LATTERRVASAWIGEERTDVEQDDGAPS
jgi:hypothetical protein